MKTTKTPPAPRRPKVKFGPYKKGLPKYNQLAGGLRRARDQIAAGVERERKLQAAIGQLEEKVEELVKRLKTKIHKTTGPDENGSAYIYLVDEIGEGGVFKTLEAIPNRVNLDIDTAGRLLGIEILGLAVAE